MLIVDTTKNILFDIISVTETIIFASLSRREDHTAIYMQEQNFNQTQASGYNPVLF